TCSHRPFSGPPAPGRRTPGPSLWTSGAGRIRPASPVLDHLALEDPHLHTDRAVRRHRRRLRVIDVGAQRVQRYSPFVIPFRTRDLGAAEAAAALDLDPLGARAHRVLHRALHRTPERDPLRELVRDVVRDELRVQLRALDLLDVYRDLALRQVGQLVTQTVDLGALLADHDARARRVDRHHDLLRLALDLDLRDRGPGQPLVEVLPDRLVFLQQLVEVPLSLPARLPRIDHRYSACRSIAT